MLDKIIKLTTGYTIDRRYRGEDPCPRCGELSVYHVMEDDYTVFCTEAGCSFRDKTYYPKGKSYYEAQRNYYRELFEQAFSYGGAIFLKKNDNHSTIINPVIIMSDVLDYRYNIRSWSPKGPHWGAYNEETPILISYNTIDDMIDDGWRPD